MKNDINLDTPRTGVPSDAYKSGWDAIFGRSYSSEPKETSERSERSLWRKRQVDAEIPKHDVKSSVGDW